jgi:hypothetical protein
MYWPSCLLEARRAAAKRHRLTFVLRGSPAPQGRHRLTFSRTGVGRGRSASCYSRTRHPVRVWGASAQGEPVVGRTRRDVSTAETITWIKETAERPVEGGKTPALVVHDAQPERLDPLGTGLRSPDRRGDRVGRAPKSGREGFCGHTKHILGCRPSSTNFSRGTTLAPLPAAQTVTRSPVLERFTKKEFRPD